MGIQAEVNDAIDEGRDDLIRVLAEQRILPTVVEQASSGSGLLGEPTPTFGLDPQTDDAGTIDRQTTGDILSALDIDSEEDCESVREEIRNHAAW